MNIEEFRIRMKLTDQQYQRLKDTMTIPINGNPTKVVKTKFDISTKKLIVS